ncbi:MAG: hypothetical protein LH654_00360 [Thermoleophilia bacterium]|nr:hypothetical protein [Thermoleophilia bacterium]
MTLLGRAAGYKAPWVGRTALALIIALWLFVTFVGFGVSAATGLEFLIVGGVLLVVEVWIERNGKGHSTFVLVWHLVWRVGMGAIVISKGVANGGWGLAIRALVGCWLILSGAGIAWLRWLAARAAGDGTKT